MNHKKTTTLLLIAGLMASSLVIAQDNSSFYQMFDNYQKETKKDNEKSPEHFTQSNNVTEETVIIDKQTKSKETINNLQNIRPKSCFDYNAEPIDYDTTKTTLNNISFNIPTTQWNSNKLFIIHINPKNNKIKLIKAIILQGQKSINIPNTYWDQENNNLLLFPLSTQPLHTNIYNGNANLHIYIENDNNQILNKQMSIRINNVNRNENNQMRTYKNSINNYQNKLSSYCN